MNQQQCVDVRQIGAQSSGLVRKSLGTINALSVRKVLLEHRLAQVIMRAYRRVENLANGPPISGDSEVCVHANRMHRCLFVVGDWAGVVVEVQRGRKRLLFFGLGGCSSALISSRLGSDPGGLAAHGRPHFRDPIQASMILEEWVGRQLW